MARQVPARNGGTLTRPDKGETMNPNGRPKKFITTLKEQGYKLSEINDTIQVLMSMNIAELKAVMTNPNATIMETTCATAMIKSLQKGSLYSLDTLMNRVFGKPKETAEITQDGTINIVFQKGKTIL